MTSLKISNDARALLCCPTCRANLAQADSSLLCTNPACGVSFPVVDGVPFLIQPKSSKVFSTLQMTPKTWNPSTPKRRIRKIAWRMLPGISLNVRAKQNYEKFISFLKRRTPPLRVLVVGGQVLGEGMEAVVRSDPPIDLIETDVSPGPRTGLVCDAHDLPFHSEAFDGVIVQAVLEHVFDPYRCVEEIHRVLKKNALVYAETPFIQQVHEGRYDFTRFTHLGHRRLFRRFAEFESGATCGPGMALAWSYQYFLLSFSESGIARNVLKAFARFTSFYLKYFDYYLIAKRGALDAASACYFLGEKSEQTITDEELIEQYRGFG